MAINLNSKYPVAERSRAVIDHGAGLLVVSAGPGTGKTTSLLAKISALLDNGVDPAGVYYLTFVNSIVDAFKDDFARPKPFGLGKSVDEVGIKVNTLHSLAFKIITAYAKELEIPDHLELVELNPNTKQAQSACFVDDLYTLAKSRGVVVDRSEFKLAIRKIVSGWRDLAKHDAEVKSLKKLVIILSERYEIRDWDSLVVLALTAAKEHGLPKWLHDAKHFLVDEYQDFNRAEQRLIERITEPSDSVIIVGDPDQSIYSGRGASPDGLRAIQQNEQVSVVNFTVCYRCPRSVVDAANRLLEHLDPAECKDRILEYSKDDDGVATLVTCASCKQEVEWLVKTIHKLQESGIKEIALLFPTRTALEFYHAKLSDASIRCQIRTTDEERELQSAYLRLAVLRSHPYLERVLLSKFPQAEAKFRQYRLETLLDGTDRVPELIQSIIGEKGIRKTVKEEIGQYASAFTNITSGDAVKVSAVLELLGVPLAPEIIQTVLDYDSTVPLREHIDNALKQPEAEQSEDETAGSVELLTMHSAKGLSRDSIVIPAFEDKWLPGMAAGEKLNEQHRLVYVAATRAKKHLVCTYPKSRAKGDPLNYLPNGATDGVSRYADVMKLKKS